MIQQIRKAHNFFLRLVDILRDPVLLIARLIWGCLLMHEGYSKFATLESTASWYQSLGMPMPTLMVILSASVELGGGLLLLLGLFTRIASVPVIVTMAVAAITVPAKSFFLDHGYSQTESFTSQTPLVFMYVAIVTLLFGAGKLSLDYILKDKWFLCR